MQYNVFARVSPEQKYLIIKLLQENHHEIGFLGEGINDAPALKIANVALVVQGASDIARDVADIVLLNSSLEVIINGIKEGREVFANTIKYIKATLASNFGNFYAIAIVSLFIDYLPMLPLQILLLNLLSDMPMISIATDTVDPDELRRPKDYNVKDLMVLATTLGLVSTIFDFIFFAVFYHTDQATLQTSWFIGSILTELVFLYSIRTRFFFLRAKRASTPILFLTAIAAILTVGIPFTAFGHNIFSFTSLSLNNLIIIFAIVIGYLITTEIIKLIYYKIVNNNPRKRLHSKA
jgi:Mg2+-importing ATPase